MSNNRLEDIGRNANISKESIMKNFFNVGSKIELGWNIYVYSGCYKDGVDEEHRYNYRCYDIAQADYVLYKNLINNFDEQCVVPLLCDDFEINKIIIRFNSFQFIGHKYHQLRNFYFNELMNGRKEEDILRILEEDREKFGIKSIDRDRKSDSKVRLLSKRSEDNE